jgi:hypothetical protein
MTHQESLIESSRILLEGKDEAIAIRSILVKEFRLSSRDVSVKTQYGGTSSMVWVELKTTKALPFISKIKGIADDFDKYTTDGQGEILQGGNTFIQVSIDYDFEVSLRNMINNEFKKQSKNGFSLGDKVKLFKTFTVHFYERGIIMVSVGTKTLSTTDVSGIGSTVLSFIEKYAKTELYAKIK